MSSLSLATSVAAAARTTSHHSSISSSILPLSCDLCTMRFGTVQALHKHAVFVHAFRGSNSGLSNSGKDLSPLDTSGGGGPLFCIRCALPFPSPASFAEHYVLVHGSSTAANILGIPSPVQLKPTDLSLTKKTSKHPSPSPGPPDERPPSGKRFKVNSENGLSPNCPRPRSVSRTPTVSI